MRYVLALDQGTTSSRAIVSTSAARRALGAEGVPPAFPAAGWVEHDAVEILRTQIACARAALKKAKLAPERLAAIGITNQRETTVVWDRRTGKPVHRAIVWQDRPHRARCEALKREGLEATVQAKTGLVIDPYFSATKLEWLLDNVSGVRARADRGELAFGTNRHLARVGSSRAVSSTSPTRATPRAPCSTTSTAANGTKSCFGSSACRARCSRKSCPPPTSTATTAKNVLGAELPIAGIAGDQQAALFGQACHEEGHGEEHLWHRMLSPGSTRATRRSHRATA